MPPCACVDSCYCPGISAVELINAFETAGKTYPKRFRAYALQGRAVSFTMGMMGMMEVSPFPTKQIIPQHPAEPPKLENPFGKEFDRVVSPHLCIALLVFVCVAAFYITTYAFAFVLDLMPNVPSEKTFQKICVVIGLYVMFAIVGAIISAAVVQGEAIEKEKKEEP